MGRNPGIIGHAWHGGNTCKALREVGIETILPNRACFAIIAPLKNAKKKNESREGFFAVIAHINTHTVRAASARFVSPQGPRETRRRSGQVSAWKVVVGLSLGIHGGICLAQALPDPAADLRRQELQLKQLRQRNEALPDIRLQGAAAKARARLPEETPCFPIASVIFAGASLALSELHQALSGPLRDDSPEGRCLGAQGIRLLLDRAQNALIGRGYITSRVMALPQDLKAGELVLSIEPGRIGQIIRQAPAISMPADIAFLATRPGAVLDLRDIEQTLENLRRNPNAETDIQISPGEIAGTSDIHIRYRLDKPWRLNLNLDDSGSKTTGKVQGNATLSLDNPLGMADIAYVSLGQDLWGRDPGPRGSRNYAMHYSVPLGYWLLGVTASRNRYHQTVPGAFQSYLYSGRSSTGELQITRVLRRAAGSKTSASLKAFARASNNYIDDTEVEVQRRRTGGWEAGLQHTHYLGQSTLESQIQYRRGTGAFGAMRAPEENFGEGTSRMRLTQASLSWFTPLSVGATKLQYSGHLRAQWSGTPLTPQDRFCIGGRYTVRGFDGVQNLCADQGQLWRNEISAALGAYPIQVFGGIDMGRVSGANSEYLVGKQLAGAVLGLRGAWQTGTHGALQYELFIGKPLHRPQGFETAHTAAGFSFALGF